MQTLATILGTNEERDVLVMNRDEVQSTKLAIDMRDKLRDLALQLRRVGQRRARHLYEHDIPNPFGVVLHKPFKRPQLLYDTLHDIKLISRDDDLLALVECSQSIDLRVDAWTSSIDRDTSSVDADGTVYDASDVPLVVDTKALTSCSGLIPTHANTRAREMSRVAVRLEADQVCAEHAVEDLLALRKAAEDL